MVAPIITTLTEDNPRTDNKMSHTTGFTQSICTIAFDQAITKYSINRGGADHLSGTVLESGNVSFTAGQQWNFTLLDTHLTDGANTINFYGMNSNGEWSDGLTEVTKPTVRYLRIDGYGEFYSATSYNTTRMVEVEVFSSAVNVMSTKTGSTDSPVDTGAETGSTSPTRVTDGVKGITANTYNIWWDDITLNGGAGNAWVKFDLGAQYPIDSIRYWSYPSRSPRFKIWGTNNLADFGANGAISGSPVLIWDESANNGAKVCGATAGTNNYIEKVF